VADVMSVPVATVTGGDHPVRGVGNFIGPDPLCRSSETV
jgi:hypothetical protein